MEKFSKKVVHKIRNRILTSSVRWTGEHSRLCIAFRLQNEPLGNITATSTEKPDSWTRYVSQGGLHQANDEFISKIKELDKIFRATDVTRIDLIDNLLKDSKVFKCSEESKRIFFRTQKLNI